MKKLIGIIALISLCLMACNTDNEDNHEAANNSICFVANETRAAADISNIQTEGFKVWGGYGTTTVFNGENIVLGSDNTHTTDKKWTFNTYNFYAVYPTTVNAAYTPPTTFTINNYNVKDNKGTDLMIATATNHVYPDNGEAVGLYFRHALAQLEFVGKSLSAIAPALLKKIAVYGDGVPAAATYSESTQAWTANATTTQSNPLLTTDNGGSGWDLSNSGTTVVNGLMVFPKRNTDNVYVDLTTFDGKADKTQTLTIPAMKWENGNIYRYTFTLDPENNLTITLKIKKWNELDSSYNITF